LVILFLISNPILGNPQYQGNLFYTIRAMKKQSDSDFDVKCATVQFYRNSYNSQFDNWIGLKLYVESLDMSSYLGLKFQVNRSLERHCNIGQQSMYEFCYLLSFDLWTSYLARIFFYKDEIVGFGDFLVLLGYLMANNIVSMCDMDSVLMWNPYGIWKQLFYLYYSRNPSLWCKDTLQPRKLKRRQLQIWFS
jgi:hypothetical protein